jgi:phosphate transport system permease protein
VQVSMGDTPAGGIEYMSVFAVGSLLFVLTLIFNTIGGMIVMKAPKGLNT